jgi:hypothetical protein
VAEVEDRLIHQLYQPRTRFSPISWDKVTEAVWLPFYRKMISHHAKPFSQLVPSALGVASTRIDDWARRLRSGLGLLSPEAEQKKVLSLFGAWLVVTLADAGFRIDATPGRPVRAERNGTSIEPFLLVSKLAKDASARAEWSRLSVELGLS